MKRFFAFVMIFCFVLGTVPALAYSVTSGDFSYEVYDEEAYLTGYSGSASVVEIPDEIDGIPVTAISQRAFYNNTNITKVIIPDSVKTIYYSAFSGCSELIEVVFSENLEEVGAYAFIECVNLKSVTLPKGVLEIQEMAFGYYTDMKTGDAFRIGDFKINGYTNSAAENYALENEFSFTSLGVAPLYIYETEELGDHKTARIIKYNGREKNVVVPDDFEGYEVVTIDPYAFSANVYIESVTLPENLTSILGKAFSSCSNLKTVTFGGSWLSIRDKAFNDCTSLESLNVDENLNCNIGSDVFKGTPLLNNCKDDIFYFATCLVKAKTETDSVQIKEGIRSIADDAFRDCKYITEIVIPKSVERIGSGAFRGCDALQSVIMMPFDNEYEQRYVSEFAFLDCSSLKKFVACEKTEFGRYSVGYVYKYVEDLGYWNYVKQENGPTICGILGSPAQTYATENGFAFEEYDFSNMPSPHTHSFSPATCETPAKCTCGEVQGGATGHKPVKNITPAQALKDGKVETVCSVCNITLSTTAISGIKGVKMLKTTYVYSGKQVKPLFVVTDLSGKQLGAENYDVLYPSEAKTVGKYTIKISFKGEYKGSAEASFKIVPKATKISKVTPAKKKLKITWKKQTKQTDGYKIQYSTSKKFKKAKTVTIDSNKTAKTTIKKLKSKKTYYLRVRTYKKTGKQLYYSSWSAVKNIKTK